MHASSPAAASALDLAHGAARPLPLVRTSAHGRAARPGAPGHVAVPQRALLLLRIVLLATLLLASLPSWPALGQFNGDFRIQRHRLADENFLDWKAYQFPLDWRVEWALARNALRGSVGSVAEERFYQAVELKLSKDLGRYAALAYEQREESFFRSEPVQQQVELRVGEVVYGSILGWTQHLKANGSMGAAVSYHTPEAPVFLRLSHLEQYALFNLRTEGDDVYSPIPTLERIQFRWFDAGGLHVQGEVRNEPPARLKVAQPAASRSYSGNEGELLVFWRSTGDWTAGFEVFDDLEHRRYTPGAGSTGPGAAQALRLSRLDVFWRHRLSADNLATIGWLDSRFSNAIDSDEAADGYRFRLFTTQVYGRWEHRQSDWVRWHYALHVGHVHLFESVGGVRNDEDSTDGLQAKVGVGIALVEPASYSVLFNTTWDIDIIDKKQWDGGNVQLVLYF